MPSINIDPIVEKIEKIKLLYRLLILVGFIALMAGAFAYVIYLPKTEEIEKTQKNIAGLKSKVNRARIKSRKLPKFKAERAEVATQFQEALTLLPNKKEIPTLLRTITQFGSDSQLEFRLFSPQRERAKEFYMEIPVSIEVSGNYHNVAVFFEKVGGMDRIVNILNVSMNPVNERSTTLVTKCDAVTYRFKGGIDEGTAAKK